MNREERNVPAEMPTINPRIPEAQQSPRSVKKTRPRRIIIKWFRSSDEEKFKSCQIYKKD
jgi:hypothetical protein